MMNSDIKLKSKEEIIDEENELQIQKTLEADMFDEEYTKEEMEAAEAKAEMAYDAHKEECPKIDHEDCF